MRDNTSGTPSVSKNLAIAIEIKAGVVPPTRFFDPYLLTEEEVQFLGFEHITARLYSIPAWLKPYIKTGITLITRQGAYFLNAYHSRRSEIDGTQLTTYADADSYPADHFIVSFDEDGLTTHRWYVEDRREAGVN